MRVHRRPHEREAELEHLRGGPEPRVIAETAPRQPGALERVVEDDAVALGDQQRLRALPGGEQELGDRVRREVPRRRPHDDQRPVAVERLPGGRAALVTARDRQCPSGSRACAGKFWSL